MSDAKEAYDLIFDTSSVQDLLTRGHWDIDLNTDDTVLQGGLVAIVGLYNKGKTYLANRLGGTKLPTGATISTRGLSFKRPICLALKDRIVLVDSAGSGVPVVSGGQAAQLDRRVVEEVITRVLFEISDYYIVVVNDLTKSDQDLVTELLTAIEEKKHTHLLLVHNFVQATEADFKKHYERFKTYYPKGRADERDGGITYICEITGSSGSSIALEHFFLVNESNPTDEASRTFNDATIKRITEVLLTRNIKVVNRKDDIVGKVIEAMERILFEYLAKDESKSQPQNVKMKKSTDAVAKETRKLSLALYPDDSRKQMIKLHEHGLWKIMDLPQKEVLVGHTTTPKYSILYRGDQAAPDEYVVIIEVPGLTKPTDVTLADGKNGSKIIQGRRPSHYLESDSAMQTVHRRICGAEWKIHVGIPHGMRVQWPEVVRLDAGVCSVHFYAYGKPRPKPPKSLWK